MPFRLRTVPLILLFLFFVCAARAQETDDPDWFWNKPISDITFENLNHVKRSELTGITSGYLGKRFTESLYVELTDRLYSLDVFADIAPYAKPDERRSGYVILVFSVTERPIVTKIVFSGNQKVRTGELRDAVRTKVNDVYVESKVLIDERELRNLYLKKGYTSVHISNTAEESDDGVTVTFSIDEGVNTVITAINFQGNSVISARTLKGKISLRETGFLRDGSFQRSSLEADRQAIVAYYQNLGYVDARVVDVLEESAVNEEKGRNEVTLTFIIQEGMQYTYNGVTIYGNTIFSSEELTALIKLKTGDIYNNTRFQEGLQNIVTLYAENGYMTNQYLPLIEKDTDRRTVSYTLTIQERSRSHIEHIIVQGNTKTKDYVILRELPLEPGDVFSREKLMTGLRNLYNLQYFSSIVPEPVQGSEDNLVDLIISVEEQSTTALNFGLTFSGVSNPRDLPLSLFARIENSNLRGEGRTISADTTISTATQSISFSYGQNWLFEQPISWSESLALAHSTEQSLTNHPLVEGGYNVNSYYFKYQQWSATLNSSFGRRWTPDFAIISLTGGLSNAILSNPYQSELYVPVDTAI
ncbi:MAG: outer membrane protein assembly factor BamA, partial [Treponema sp.]|nr:outer membrane protein assembly factor BamA [Treponema sp.]